MFNFSSRSFLGLVVATLLVGSFANAKDASKETKPLKRKIAADSFSGARVGSSGLYEVGSTDEAGMKTDMPRFEKIEIVKKIDKGRIALVQVDGGGSTDIGSLMVSSTLLLTFWEDGEMSNKKAAFLLGGVNSFKIKENKGSVITVELKCKNDELKDITVNSIINFEKFEKEFAKPLNAPDDDTNDFNDTVISGKVTMTKKCLPDFE
jgi:hypothetical protein